MTDIMDRVDLNAKADMQFGFPTSSGSDSRQKLGLEVDVPLFSHAGVFFGGAINMGDQDEYQLSRSLSVGARFTTGAFTEKLKLFFDAGASRQTGKYRRGGYSEGFVYDVRDSDGYKNSMEESNYASWLYHFAPGLKYQIADRFDLSLALTLNAPMNKRSYDPSFTGVEAGLAYRFF